MLLKTSCRCTDLVRSIEPVPADLDMDFLRISSYVGTQSSGTSTMGMQSRLPIKGRHVLVVSHAIFKQLADLMLLTSDLHICFIITCMNACKCPVLVPTISSVRVVSSVPVPGHASALE